ncbi:DUF4159 domain-containing protein [Tenacibaculum maritimum]|uniref:DUF4159 domain-containing protein n=1 Tax=Tenacibaculum maritimum TaxID=107401 RepID=UPI001E5D419F|nr:DUF4159 domain-containing protein [Tenacibaculum maritimum]MCD9586005.1 DUF4159 domain-containing protein [Tenacibaculum maritimum]MCD9611539.1 DUF4159 domain-containing protein [Tenacibaculum maritimum]MCD9619452.1 DUF4159 domain-containing protein [Tenacibaculum maritimum]MCD9626207.1 DUF4159 domain-containing protein [Tenacibaculum maritimum]MCD9630587.1 DUF4159 domain-containing protein [Tenacibaculum maritimum]
MKNFLFLISFLLLSFFSFSQQVGILKYHGGGDWYANPTALPNLIEFSNQYAHTKINKTILTVTPDSEDLYNCPILFMTGHGNVFFSDEDLQNLKMYLMSGGFLHISDNYGLDTHIRRELKKLFPMLSLQEIPKEHPIYHQTFSFPKGMPKIHEHDKKPPQGFGLFYEGRLIVFYDYESDLSDGWEDSEIHHNPKHVRQKALQMGSNIIEYAFKN